jgi:type VI secretion system secreted protein VgrG
MSNPIAALLNSSGRNRLLSLSFPDNDGPDATLLINQLHAQEQVSADFVYTATLLSDDDEIELKSVLAKLVCIKLKREDGSERLFTGYCFEFRLLTIENSLAVYEMVLRPWMAILALRRDYATFIEKNITDQTKELFNQTGLSRFDIRTREPDPVRHYSCQYNETTQNYLHRRFEEMGWFYWYEHEASGHTLILADYSPESAPIDGNKNVPYHHDGGDNEHDKISQWSPSRKLVSGKVTFSSFDYKKPTPAKVQRISELEQGIISKHEVHDYDGLLGFKDEDHGVKIANRRLEQINAPAKSFTGVSEHRALQPGRWFKLTKEHGASMYEGGAKNDFFILSVTHTAHNNYLNAAGGEARYSNTFTCLRRAIVWRPPPGYASVPVTAPHIDTATVVGLAGEEIHTDAQGRIKVQFHWDRKGKFNGQSSAWVRVMTPWADQNFGMIAIPRVGTEVVVQYLQGNPDKPMVMGQAWNSQHMPPWDLPANKTQTGILTRSSKGGSAANANAFRFEDKKGDEEIWMHAEKNQRIEVENDESHWVGHDRRKTIDHDETTHVKHDRTETVDHDEKITVHNNRTERVDHDEKVSIGDNRHEDVGKNEDVRIGHSRSVHVGDHKSETVGKTKAETVALAKFLTVGGLYQTSVGGVQNTTVAMAQLEEVGLSKTVVVGKTITLSAGEQLKITVGKSSFTMNADGRIEISGTEVLISGSKKVEIHGKDIDNNPK